MVSPNRTIGSQFQTLARQGSVYNPSSFDEVQIQMGNIMGKPMNLNELVIKSVEDHGQIVQNPSSSSSSSASSVSVSMSPPASHFLGNINLNGRLSKKTIDEVFKEINNEIDNQSLHHHHHQQQQQQRQLKLGETAIEDFLLRAGVINIGSHNQNGVVNHHHHQPFVAIDPMVVVSQQADLLHFQMATSQHHQMTVMDASFNVSESVYENPVADIVYSENQLALTMPVPAIPATPSDSKVNNDRKRRFSDEIMEKMIERRQKRMIKNRESAARSRARKQAYTNQLESQVFRLRKRNTCLKKQKEVEMVLSTNPIPMPKYQLRRTSSV